jgi:outer membrane receptor protein involved in Fe transport
MLPLRDLELFANYGVGFHSNDARDVVANEQQDLGFETLPRAEGWELGLRTQLLRRFDLALDYWWLNLQSELVWVGDEGTTEPSLPSRRQGIEAAAGWWMLDWLQWTGALGYSEARFADGTYVPQAPRFVGWSALSAFHRPSGLAGSLRFRGFGPRCGDEACSVNLRPGYVFDLGLEYRFGPLLAFFFVENLFDAEYPASEFAFESLLPSDPTFPTGPGVFDRHFTPGNPRNVRGGLAVLF